MENLQITVGEKLIYTSDCRSLSTTLYIQIGEKCFPDEQWTDLTYSVLTMWASKILSMSSKPQTFTLNFLDGPYCIKISGRINDALNIGCYRYDKLTICEICTWSNMLSAMYEALKKLSYLMYSSGLYKDELNPAYNEINILMKRFRGESAK